MSIIDLLKLHWMVVERADCTSPLVCFNDDGGDGGGGDGDDGDGDDDGAADGAADGGDDDGDDDGDDAADAADAEAAAAADPNADPEAAFEFTDAPAGWGLEAFGAAPEGFDISLDQAAPGAPEPGMPEPDPGLPDPAVGIQDMVAAAREAQAQATQQDREAAAKEMQAAIDKDPSLAALFGTVAAQAQTNVDQYGRDITVGPMGPGVGQGGIAGTATGVGQTGPGSPGAPGGQNAPGGAAAPGGIDYNIAGPDAPAGAPGGQGQGSQGGQGGQSGQGSQDAADTGTGGFGGFGTVGGFGSGIGAILSQLGPSSAAAQGLPPADVTVGPGLDKGKDPSRAPFTPREIPFVPDIPGRGTARSAAPGLTSPARSSAPFGSYGTGISDPSDFGTIGGRGPAGVGTMSPGPGQSPGTVAAQQAAFAPPGAPEPAPAPSPFSIPGVPSRGVQTVSIAAPRSSVRDKDKTATFDRMFAQREPPQVPFKDRFDEVYGTTANVAAGLNDVGRGLGSVTAGTGGGGDAEAEPAAAPEPAPAPLDFSLPQDIPPGPPQGPQQEPTPAPAPAPDVPDTHGGGDAGPNEDAEPGPAYEPPPGREPVEPGPPVGPPPAPDMGPPELAPPDFGDVPYQPGMPAPLVAGRHSDERRDAIAEELLRRQLMSGGFV